MQPMLNIALRAARSAGELIFRSIERLDVISVNEKDAKDYVTEVDRAAEQTIVAALRKAYPTHAIMGEEGGFIERQRRGRRLPLGDRSAGRHHQLHPWRTALRREHRLQVQGPPGARRGPRPGTPGRIHRQPRSRRRLNGRRLRVSGRKSLEGALLGTGFPFRDNQIDNLDNYLNMFRSLVGQTAGIRRAGAASLDLAYVAAGRYDAFWEFGLSEWDMAAGALLVQEAGGLVSDFTGSHEFLEKGHIVAGNTKCFKALLTTIQPHLPPSLKR